MATYIPVTRFFNTGFLSLPLTTTMREKQGLMSQAISSNCYPSNYCNNFLLYPTPVVPLPTYCLKPVSAKATCARYVLPI